MLNILKYLKKKEWLMIAAGLVFIVLQVWLDLKLPDYMSDITMLVQTEGSAMNDILVQGGYMLLCALGSMAASIIVGYLSARVAATLSMRLRALVFDKTMSFSLEEINGFSTSSLITRSTNDITQVQSIVAMGMQFIIKAPILAVWAIVKISGKSWQWTLTTGISVVILLIIISCIIIFALPKFKIIQSLTDNLNQVTRENLTGLRVVRAYNAEEYQEQKFQKANRELTDTNLFTNRIMAVMQPSMSVIMSGMSLAIYWIGAILINNAGLPQEKVSIFSDMVVFSSYAMQVIMAFMMLTMIFIMLPRASVSAKRILEVLNTKTKIFDGTTTKSKSDKRGEIEFKKVSFRYPDAADYVLEDISFQVQEGETVAIIGSTGSGKSTLINLIPRFYDTSEGEILIDGINVKDYKQETLHEKLGYVSQKAILFSGSVESNIAYGSGKALEQAAEAVKQAVAIAQGSEFVEAMDGAYKANIAQGGTNLSGGQKQRLSIARAICRKPEIYIFDDSFSALDYKTDRELRSNLKNSTAKATSLIVAQRIGTIKDADRIIVLDEGKIVGAGTHRQLLKDCDVYKQIALSQLSEEELAYE